MVVVDGCSLRPSNEKQRLRVALITLSETLHGMVL
jgi:hypothetical protein